MTNISTFIARIVNPFEKDRKIRVLCLYDGTVALTDSKPPSLFNATGTEFFPGRENLVCSNPFWDGPVQERTETCPKYQVISYGSRINLD